MENTANKGKLIIYFPGLTQALYTAECVITYHTEYLINYAVVFFYLIQHAILLLYLFSIKIIRFSITGHKPTMGRETAKLRFPSRITL